MPRNQESELFLPKRFGRPLALLCRREQTKDLDGGLMETKSMKFIYQATNAIASRRHDAETEQCLADEIERELLTINPHVELEPRKGSQPLPLTSGLASEAA